MKQRCIHYESTEKKKTDIRNTQEIKNETAKEE